MEALVMIFMAFFGPPSWLFLVVHRGTASWYLPFQIWSAVGNQWRTFGRYRSPVIQALYWAQLGSASAIRRAATKWGEGYAPGNGGDVAGKAGKSRHVAPGSDFCQGTGGKGLGCPFLGLKNLKKPEIKLGKTWHFQPLK